jgi:hypothetical protein
MTKNMTRKVGWVWGGICFSIVVIGILLFSYREPLLLRAGKFMAPQRIGTADMVIVEGQEILETGAANAAIKFVSPSKDSRLVVVLHRVSANKKQFGLDDDYPDLVKKKLMLWGLAEKQVRVMVTPDQAPRTLNEAAMVLEAISKEGVRNAFLLAHGFHTRRSFLVYQHIGQPLGIKIIPVAYFNDYQIEDWWAHREGIEDFASELFKLLYYQVRGYIPLKFSY